MAVAAVPTLAVRGLIPLIRGIKGIAPDLGREVAGVNRDFARQMVPAVRARYERRYPSITGRSAATIRAGGGQGYARITIGGARARHMPGQEFGSNRVPQFRPWTGPGPSGAGSRGRFLYPTVRAEYPALKEAHVAALVRVLEKNFPEQGSPA